jgi:hypothetical protein
MDSHETQLGESLPAYHPFFLIGLIARLFINGEIK